MDAKKSKEDLWPKVGNQFERSMILQIVLEELEIYELMLQKLYEDKKLETTEYEYLRSERSIKTEIQAREKMLRVLALKNTEYVV